VTASRGSGAPRFAGPLLAAWHAPRLTPLAALLLPLSWLFRLIVATRRALYRAGVLRSLRVPRAVVVVGNLTVGGSGKTPLVEALARALAARGRRPGVISRGYGGAAIEAREVMPNDDPAIVGDEPLLLARTGFPVWIGRDRGAAARALLAAHPHVDVIIADDGLQHYALRRDVEIVVVDALRGLGNGRMLPAGPLREPASRLREAHAIVRLADAPRTPSRDGRDTTMTHEPIGLRSLVDPGRVPRPADWPHGTVHAVAGTGHPQRFFELLSSAGIDAIPHPFPDHHRFTRADLEFPGAAAILMTAKDAVKCERFADERCYALDIRAVIDPALVDLVMRRIDGHQAA
jgi:tetraacyldisaccharide 4'-kinase